MSYTNFQVGEKFPLPIKAQGDGGLFQYDVNGAMFILKLSKTDLIAIEAFRTGKIEIALFAEDGILFFLYKIDGIINGWGDCPFSLAPLPPKQRPDFTKPQEKTLNLYLVDSRLDLLLAMRSIELSGVFREKLTEILKAQADKTLPSGAYAAKVSQIWQEYTSDEMYKRAAVKQEIALDIPLPGKNVH